MTEIDLAKKVVAWLTDLGWDVYQEIQIRESGSIADIVAVLDRRVWVVECKTTMSLQLLGQAEEWKRFAHMVSVAVPLVKRRYGKRKYNNTKARFMAGLILRRFGIGELRITEGPPDEYSPMVDEVLAPILSRKAWANDILDCLTEKHKTYAEAGNAKGRRYTPFVATCDSLVRHVKRHPGCSMKEAVEGIPHHYASPQSARISLAKWIDAGVISGIEVRFEGRKKFLFPAELDP